MNSKPIKLSFLVLVFILLPVLSLADTNFPVFPMAFWGNTTLDGNLLPIGTTIRAYCNNNVIGEITMVENGIYGYDEATKNKLLVSNCDGYIIFKYLPLGASEDLTGVDELKYTEGFMPGTTKQKHLNFMSAQPPSSSGGGGGGGGGGTPPTSTSSPLSEAAQAVDANKDDKIDVLDFNTLMVNWGSTIAGNLADFDHNNKVDIFDFNLLMIHWVNL